MVRVKIDKLDPERTKKLLERKRECNRKYMRKWRSENQEEAREYKKSWYESNKSRVSEYNHTYHLSHPPRRTSNPENQRIWREANRERWRALKRADEAKRRALLSKSTVDPVTADQLSSILKNPCIYCGKPSKHIDHFMPLCRGGSHTIDNLVPSCVSCNLSKGSKIPTEWLCLLANNQ